MLRFTKGRFNVKDIDDDDNHDQHDDNYLDHRTVCCISSRANLKNEEKTEKGFVRKRTFVKEMGVEIPFAEDVVISAKTKQKKKQKKKN